MSIDTLTRVLRECFEEDSLVAVPALNLRDIESWDSFRHIAMMVGVEEAYGVVFAPSEVESIRTVGDLIAALARHGVTL